MNEGVFVECCCDDTCDKKKMMNCICKLEDNGYQCPGKEKRGKQ